MARKISFEDSLLNVAASDAQVANTMRLFRSRVPLQAWFLGSALFSGACTPASGPTDPSIAKPTATHAVDSGSANASNVPATGGTPSSDSSVEVPSEASSRGLLRVSSVGISEPCNPSALGSFVVSTRLPDGAKGRVSPGASLRSGEEIWLELSLKRAVYVHVFQVDSSGQVEVLFPLPRDPEHLPSKPGMLRMPPEGENFRLDDRTGPERLLVLLSLLPVQELDDDILSFIRQASHGTARIAPDPDTPDLLTLEFRHKTGTVARQKRPPRINPDKSPPPATGAPLAHLPTSVAERSLTCVDDVARVALVANTQDIAFADFRFWHLANSP